MFKRIGDDGIMTVITLSSDRLKKLHNLENQVQALQCWLDKNGWSKNKELPDHMAANIKVNGVSLADIVYTLVNINNDLVNVDVEGDTK